jgi:hypothetical protein
MFNDFYFDNRAIYEIMSKNVVESERPEMTSQHGGYELQG